VARRFANAEARAAGAPALNRNGKTKRYSANLPPRQSLIKPPIRTVSPIGMRCKRGSMRKAAIATRRQLLIGQYVKWNNMMIGPGIRVRLGQGRILVFSIESVFNNKLRREGRGRSYLL
jgi:hypothetical protein